jgi:4a-hydroxytetrahydrobiopterin dehydratase
MTELAGKSCVPCRGGVPPLPRAEAEGYLRQTPGWALVDDGKRIERTFKHKNFKEALAFVNRVGALAETEGHHPDITFGWGYARVSLHTHKIKGLHENDFIMAAKIDGLAAAAA